VILLRALGSVQNNSTQSSNVKTDAKKQKEFQVIDLGHHYGFTVHQWECTC
jgi:hypothetical protein